MQAIQQTYNKISSPLLENFVQYQGQVQITTPTNQVEMTGPFVHVMDLPVFQIYSLNEVQILHQRIQSNLELKHQRQDILNNMPPPPNTVDALSAKLFVELISAMGDGGTTIIVKHFNVEKIMANTLGALNAMDRSFTKEDMFCTYLRWSTPLEMTGPPIVIDIIAWYKGPKRDKLSGVQVKANSDVKIKINKESFSVKQGKSFDKTWFRGREDHWDVLVVIGDGREVTLGRVLAVERALSTVVLADFMERWKAYVVPKTSG